MIEKQCNKTNSKYTCFISISVLPKNRRHAIANISFFLDSIFIWKIFFILYYGNYWHVYIVCKQTDITKNKVEVERELNKGKAAKKEKEVKEG